MVAQSTLNTDLCFHSKSAFVTSSLAMDFFLVDFLRLDDLRGGLISWCLGNGGGSWRNRKGGGEIGEGVTIVIGF